MQALDRVCAFGRMSYEIYLSHVFVVLAGAALFRWSGSDVTNGWIWFCPVLAASLALGWLVEMCLSRPADRWLRRMTGDAPGTRRGGIKISG